MRDALECKVVKVIVDPVEGQVDGVLALIVHAHTGQDLDLQRRLLHTIHDLRLVHLRELVNHPVFQGQGRQVSGVGTLLV